MRAPHEPRTTPRRATRVSFRALLATAAATGVAVLAACGDDGAGPVDPSPPEPAEPAVVRIDPAEATLTAIGDTLPLAAAVEDAAGEAMPEAPVEWTGLTDSVATVDSVGVVTAAAEGVAEVVAAAGSVEDTAHVTVAPVGRRVEIEPSTATLHAIGDSLRLTAEVRDANGNVVEDAAVAWTSLATRVATVDSVGRLVAVAEGDARVRAAAADGFAEATYEVRQVPASLELSPATDTLAERDTLALAASVVDSNGVAIRDPTITWTTSNPATATVDTTGLVIARRGETSARIGAAAGPASASAEIVVLGKIAFWRVDTASVNPARTIQLVNTDGSDAHAITDPSVDARHPAWSRGAAALAVVVPAEFNTDIQVVPAAGAFGDTVTLTTSPATDDQPAWSPDRSEIAFHSRRDGNSEIYVVAADGTGAPRNVINDSTEAWTDREPTWSPDGTRIAFESDRGGDGDYDIWVVDADGGAAPRPLIATPDGEAYPAWSPDGTRIAYAASYAGEVGLFVMNADGSGSPLRLTTAEYVDAHPTWSPRGTRIAFERVRTDGSRAIYVVDAAGGSPPRPLVDSDAFDARRPAWRPVPPL